MQPGVRPHRCAFFGTPFAWEVLHMLTHASTLSQPLLWTPTHGDLSLGLASHTSPNPTAPSKLEIGGMQPGVRPARCAFSARPLREGCSTCSCAACVRIRVPCLASPGPATRRVPGRVARACRRRRRRRKRCGGVHVPRRLTRASIGGLRGLRAHALFAERRGHLSPLARTGGRFRAAQAARQQGGKAARSRRATRASSRGPADLPSRWCRSSTHS